MADVKQRKTNDNKPTQGKDANPTTNAPPSEHDWSWSSFTTWPASIKLSPLALALVGIFISIYWHHFTTLNQIDTTTRETCLATFTFPFHINAARHQAETLATHSWEIGTAALGIGELVNPEKAVWAGSGAFPDGKVPGQGLMLDQALIWSYQKINTSGAQLFADVDAAVVSDPAALGVQATMLATRWAQYGDAAEREKEYLLKEAPRYLNGAISHRSDVKELWSDAVMMVPPFLAYYAVYTEDLDLMKLAFRQVMLYRDGLIINRGPLEGLWKHIKSPSAERKDEGAWSTGNAWAAYGMARVRATISAWEKSHEVMTKARDELDSWIGEILDGAIRTDNDASGLLKNYLGDDSWWAETSGTSLLAATAYRMAVLKPERFAVEKYVTWAHQKRQAVFDRVNGDGIVQPAVNPYRHDSREPVEGSPEGESFLMILGAAWRDCVCAGICSTQSVYERH